MIRRTALWVSTGLVLVAAHATAQTTPPQMRASDLVASRAALDKAEVALLEALKAVRAARGGDAVQAAPVQPAKAPLVKPPEALTVKVVGADVETPELVRWTVDASGKPEVSATEQRALSRGFRLAASTTIANGPNDGLLKISKAPDVQLLAAEKDKIASVSLGFSNSRMQGLHLLTNQLGVTVSSKLDDHGSAELVGLRGFTNGTEVEVGYTFFSSRVNLDGRVKPGVLLAEAACRDKLGVDETAEVCRSDLGEGPGPFMAKYLPGALVPTIQEVLPGHATFAGVKFSGNQATYKYLDRAAFAFNKDDHFGFGATVFGGLLTNQGRTSLTGAFSYRRSYDEQGSVNLCQPVAGTIQTQCLTGPDGHPDRLNRALLTAEVRHMFNVPIGENARFAIAPEFTADVEHDAYSVSVPFYFAGDKDGQLRAGVRAVYLNEKDKVKGGRSEDFTVGLFFGAPFSVFSN